MEYATRKKYHNKNGQPGGRLSTWQGTATRVAAAEGIEAEAVEIGCYNCQEERHFDPKCLSSNCLEWFFLLEG